MRHACAWSLALLVVAVGATPALGRARVHRPLGAALAYWHSRKCEYPPDRGLWIPGFRFNVLYGNCRAADGHDQHVFFFDRGRFVGTDGLGTSAAVLGMWRDDTRFAFMYVIYKPSDALCCPTGGGRIVRFRWDGRRFHRLDPAPPRLTSTRAGR
jgi:hypothetical protein